MREIQTSYGPVDLGLKATGDEQVLVNEKLASVQYGLFEVNIRLIREQNEAQKAAKAAQKAAKDTLKAVRSASGASPVPEKLPRRLRSKAHRRSRHAQS